MQTSDADPSRKGRLIIVTGISGSGKTVALRALEDLNYYCIDNLPVSLMRAFAVQIMTDDAPLYDRVAVGIDIRNDPDRLGELPSLLEELKAGPHSNQVNWDLIEELKPFGGVRIEDDVLVNESGHEVLSAAVPKAPAEIEALIADVGSRLQ